MKVKEVSDTLQVSAQTVRNWASDFAHLLGPAASPEPGGVRQFSEADLRILNGVKFLKAQGFEYPEIKAKLSEASPEDFADLPIPEPPARGGSLEVPVFRIMEDLRTENAELRGRNIDLERKLAKIEAQLVYHQKSLWDRVRGR